MKKGLLIGVGIAIGILLTFGFFILLSKTEDESGYLLRRRKVTFGDIQMRINQPKSTFEGQNHWEIWILKNNVPFALITQNENKETSGFFIAKDFNERSVASIEPANAFGKWKNLRYSNINLKGKRTGISLTDFDLDGDFDFELIVDGNNTSRFLHIGSDWLHVDKYDSNQSTAVSGGATFVFHEGIGWVKQ